MTLDLTTWGKYLMPLNLILIAYDLDEAGEIGAKKLISNSDVIHSIQVPKLRPTDKDLTDYKSAGGDLSEWFRYHLGQKITLKSGWRLNAISLGAIIHEIKDGED